MSAASHENRESFFARLYPFFGPSVLIDIELAYILAKHGHRSQTRKETDEAGVPIRYFEHVRRVALILIDEAKCIVREMVLAAILHDTVEDTRDVTPEMVEHCFGPDVVGIVKVLSKDPKEGYLERFAVCTDWRPYLIKACDRLDNLRSLLHPGTGRAFQEKQVKETVEKYFPLFDRMVDLAPPEYKARVANIRDLIRQETIRVQATLAATPPTPAPAQA